VKHAKRLLKNQVAAAELVGKMLFLSERLPVSLLDSCGVSHLKSRFLIGGLDPLETFEITSADPHETLRFLDEKLETPDVFAFFTISYDFGLKLEKITPQKRTDSREEPDVYLAIFDSVIIHDYEAGETFLLGNEREFSRIEDMIFSAKPAFARAPECQFGASKVKSNFTKTEYLTKIEEIKNFIRRGDTYQTNLTQQFTAELPEGLTPQQVFLNLRKHHPAPFAAFLRRKDSTVVSASPERFFRVNSETGNPKPQITTSPIKGTRPRGETAAEDERLRNELLSSEKDRAENVMIVDLLRNDLGRICEFGSVRVEKLCDLESHPTLFHLVSTVTGTLRSNTEFSEILRAVFPCGSITGAPKIRTMRIIEALEPAARGLSMGAIGFYSSQWSAIGDQNTNLTDQRGPTADRYFDLSVAIRTMVIKNRRAVFNVGGGIVIDSDPEDEYEETLTKAKALLNSINGIF
jgi:para-aminobenzoate synthetase component 1